jgi:glycerol uptake facilitator-like aquaporin
MYLQSYFVEFFGTMFFVYITLATGNPLAIGAALALVILLTHNISGGCINPVVTIVMSSAGQLPSSEVIPYCLAQIFGGLVALEIYKNVSTNGSATNGFASMMSSTSVGERGGKK